MRTGNPGQRFLICETLEGFESFQGYADSIAELFHAHMERVEFLNDEDLCLRSMLKKIPEGYGLVLLGPQAKTHRKHLLAPLFHETLAMELPISLLIVPKTRWPISKILVLIQGEPHDDAAVEWGIRLAKASRAEMTLLATVPQVPIMFQGLDQIEGGLPEILSRKSKLGRQLRWAAGRLVEEGLDGTVQLRQGTQEMEIRSELLDRDHDIVIVGAEDQDWLHRVVCSGHPCRFLQWTDRPMLIAK